MPGSRRDHRRNYVEREYDDRDYDRQYPVQYPAASLPVSSVSRHSAVYYSTYDAPSMQPTMPSAQAMSQPIYTTGGPVRPPTLVDQEPYIQTSVQLPTPEPTSRIALSKEWTSDMDEQLLAARRKGLGWKEIGNMFPPRSSNACRKHHERLMERAERLAEWDQDRIDELATNYVQLRDEMWAPLARAMGDGVKWQSVEEQIFTYGLSNIRARARNGGGGRRQRREDHSRQQRREEQDHTSSHAPVTVRSSHSRGHSASYHRYSQNSTDEQSALRLQDQSGLSINGYSPRDDERRNSPNDNVTYTNWPMPAGYNMGYMSATQQRPAYGQQRMPSTDMGIPSIINGSHRGR